MTRTIYAFNQTTGTHRYLGRVTGRAEWNPPLGEGEVYVLGDEEGWIDVREVWHPNSRYTRFPTDPEIQVKEHDGSVLTVERPENPHAFWSRVTDWFAAFRPYERENPDQTHTSVDESHLDGLSTWEPGKELPPPGIYCHVCFPEEEGLEPMTCKVLDHVPTKFGTAAVYFVEGWDIVGFCSDPSHFRELGDTRAEKFLEAAREVLYREIEDDLLVDLYNAIEAGRFPGLAFTEN